MRWLLMAATLPMFAAFVPDVPLRITPIDELNGLDALAHAELLQVRRDFGKPNVNVALDAWMAADGSPTIHEVRVWWSDEVDRFPFNRFTEHYLGLEYRRLRPDLWRIIVVGDGKRFSFEVGLDDGRPAAFTDIMVPGGEVVKRCRADSAKLYARRVLGIPVGVHSLIVTCQASDGTVHRAAVVHESTRGKKADSQPEVPANAGG